MNKIDRRIAYRVVLDTETCPLDKDFEGVDPNNMWVYDVGYAIVDKRGKVYRERSFINADIFLNEKLLMNSSYYAHKISQYWEDVKSGKRVLTSFYNIRKTLLADIAEFEVKEVYAHNMRFDCLSLNNTERWLTKSQYRYFLPKDVVVCDTMKMARDVIAKMPTYKRFCEEHSYMTKNNQVQLKAETLYKFISKDLDFVESHTGLEDVMIEKEILAYCYKQHKAMRKKLWEK